MSASAASAKDLASLVQAYRERPTVARRTQLESFAAAHAKDQKGALARLSLGIALLSRKTIRARLRI